MPYCFQGHDEKRSEFEELRLADARQILSRLFSAIDTFVACIRDKVVQSASAVYNPAKAR